MFTLDAAGHVLTWNVCAERLTGYTSAEIVARHFSCLYSKDVQRGRQDAELRTASRTGWFEGEGWGLRKDGTRFRASVVITALFNAAGHPAGFTTIIRNLSGCQYPEDLSYATQARPVEDVQAHAAQWRAIFANGPVGMVKAGLDGRYLEVNPKFCELLGYSADELKQLNYRDLGPAEDIAEAEAYLRRLLAGEIESYTREKIFIRKDGTRIWVESSLSLVRGADGAPMYLIGVGTDITERRRAEAARRESEAAFRSIFEQAAVGIAHANLSGQIIRVNRKYADIIGYPPEALAGMTFQSVAHPDDLSLNLHLRARLLAGEIPNYTMEKRMVCRDGSTAWVNLTVSLGRDAADERPTHTIAIVEDITARKMAEQARDESQQRFALAAEAAGLGSWELDLARQCFRFSANKAVMLGYAAEERHMTVADFVALVYSEDRPMVAEKIQQALCDGMPQQAEYRVCLPDGEVRWLEARGRPILDSDGTIRQINGVSMDISARKQAELQLRELSVHLQRVREEERKRLAREIHDELGGALTAIKFDLTLPGRQDDPDPDARHQRNQEPVARVDAAIASLRRIISDLRPSVLDDLGLWAALEWQAQEFTSRSSIPCSYALHGGEIDLEPETATHLFRMVQEALTNVIRHAQAARVTIRANVTFEQIMISVQDDGIGLPADHVSDHVSYGLLGLHERARQFNGAVRISGAPGKGTLVRIWVPLPCGRQPASPSILVESTPPAPDCAPSRDD